jgi:hypothetical protein
VRSLGFAVLASLGLLVSAARADRLAVLPLESPGHPAPAIEADKLSADLIARGHRVVASADALARISAGNEGAGPDWAAQTIQSIDAARAALTRLDRAVASNMARRIGDDLVHLGGGAGGSGVLVEWCLLQRQLSLTASDSKTASLWLDAAVVFGPDIELDPLRHPDDERDLFARRRVALQSEVAASLSVATTPDAAEVWVDGVKRCQSPCSVTLLPGRHFARATSPAHAPAVMDLEIGPGVIASRRVGLTAAYSGASPKAISSMLADPSRRAEGASALEPMARFLDVEHVVALVPEGNELRVIVAPPAAGRSRLGPAVAAANLPTTMVEQLRPIAPPEENKSLFKKPGTWIIAGGVVTAIVGGFFVYQATRPQKTGTITVTSP